MGLVVTRERAERWIDASEVPMLVLAGVAVAIYLVDLAGMWAAWGLTGPYRTLALLVDLCFVVDLVAKAVVLRGAYLRSPWVLVDVICTVPILSTLSAAPTALQGLRSVRAFRVLRALRMLRVLRSLRILRLLAATTETRESRRFHRVLGLAVVGYSALFVLLVAVGRAEGPPGEVVEFGGQELAEIVDAVVIDPDGERLEASIPVDRLIQHPDDFEFHLVLGSLLGMLLILVVARFQIPALWSKQVRALLNVALPRQVADHFMEFPDAYDRNERAPATVVFCDIKGFTKSVETLDLGELKKHLERALDVIVDEHLRHDLIVDKFIGDAVMSFRGGSLVDGGPAEHARRVVLGAIGGARAIRELGDPYFSAVKVGGASSESALIGTFGASKRLSYTILGDRVNLAARLEGSCNALGVSNLFCARTRRLTDGCDGVVWRDVGPVRVAGRGEVERAFEAFHPDEDDGWIERFTSALALYESRQFSEAHLLFTSVSVHRDGGDPLSRLYAVRCAEYARHGVAADWVPVLETTK